MSDSDAKGGRSVSRRVVLRTGAIAIGLQAVQPRGWALFAPTAQQPSPCLAFGTFAYPPPLEHFIQKLHPAADDFRTEQYAEELGQILDEWSKEICRSVQSLASIKSSLSENVAASSLQPSAIEALRTEGPLLAERRLFGRAETKGRSAFLRNWQSYITPFASLDIAELEIYRIQIIGEAPLRVETEIRFDLSGLAKDGRREQRVGSWVISWMQDQQKWLAQRWIVNPEIRSNLAGPGFTDITELAFDATRPGMQQLAKGIDEWRTELDAACGIDVYGNHGIATGDIDGSGFDSIYVCQPSGLPNRLFKNRGDGSFEDITEISGTGLLDGTASALFVDFQNRGQQDLLVVRSGGPILFTNQGNGRFDPQPDAFHFNRPPQGTFTSAAVADYDRDGFLDIYFCLYSYYQGLNQYAFPAPYYDAQNGPPNFLFRNKRDGTFEDVTAASGMDENNNRYSFAAAWCDYDNDGYPDLYVANDFGRKNLYRNSGDGRFTDIAAKAGVEDYGPGMSVCWLDHNNDGFQDLYVANMWLMEGKRITGNKDFLPGAPEAIRALYQKHNAGNSLYQNDRRGGFEGKTNHAGSAMGRWSWSCAAWDFDHDGFDDLYVANGFVSGPNHYDLQSFFWRQVARRSLTPAGSSPDYEMAWNAVNELIRADYSWSGYERNVFYANNRDGTFSDVSGAVGLDLVDDSRAYALSDFDHDGRLEFVLKNRTGPQVQLWRNEMRGIGNSIVFRLNGRTSNRDAIGAVVTVESDGKRQTKFVAAGSGFASQHTKELHFGIGGQTKPVSVTVRWPSGAVERHEKVPVNCRVELVEGESDVKAAPFESRRARDAKSSAPAKAVVSEEKVRTWMISPVFGPNIPLRDLQGRSKQLSEFRGAPALLVFFRLDCSGSKQQIEQLQRASASFTATGLSIIPVAFVAASDQEAIASFVRSNKLSIPVMLADEKTGGAWNIFYRYLFDRRREMPVPICFLLDQAGAIVCLYQGVADPASILADWKSASASPGDHFKRALPFAGPYFGNPMSHNYFTDGIAFVEYGFADQARDAFQRVVEADPKHAGAWFNLGTIYLQKKMYTEARKCLDESVRLNPEDADAWNNLGLISGESGDYEQALQDFVKAARANPNHLLAVQNMMGIFQYQGRAADAQKVLDDLIAKAPENAGLHLARGMSLVAQNQLAEGLSELETSVRLGPNNPDALNDLGTLLLRMGREDEALKWFYKCVELAPDLDRPVLNIAVIYARTGQTSKARRMLEEFSGRHADNADIRRALLNLR